MSLWQDGQLVSPRPQLLGLWIGPKSDSQSLSKWVIGQPFLSLSFLSISLFCILETNFWLCKYIKWYLYALHIHRLPRSLGPASGGWRMNLVGARRKVENKRDMTTWSGSDIGMLGRSGGNVVFTGKEFCTFVYSFLSMTWEKCKKEQVQPVLLFICNFRASFLLSSLPIGTFFLGNQLGPRGPCFTPFSADPYMQGLFFFSGGEV